MLIVSASDGAAFSAAAQHLAAGRLVAFPTETVYGLGADAENDHAVARIFEVKGRPSFNPLIVHVPSLECATRYGIMTPLAMQLAALFWPGPLTLVVPRAHDSPVSLLASAGLETVALRMPAHPQAKALLTTFGRGVAAPSANRSGRLSPTRAAHVQSEYAGAPRTPDMLLAGTDCTVGLESSIVDATGEEAVILRPGSITLEMLSHHVTARPYAGTGIQAPGMLLSHYAPTLPLRINATEMCDGEALLAFGPTPLTGAAAMLNLSATGDLVEAAGNLFAHLRALDQPEWRGIAVMPIPLTGIGVAIHDRLLRAAAPRDNNEIPKNKR
jgi:L-threonylcarbamoyladenylate synthase